MNEHNITNESLALTMILVVVVTLTSNEGKLALEKDIPWNVCRAVVQLIIMGCVLKYIFDVNYSILTLSMVLSICFNVAYSAQKRSRYIDKAFLSPFTAIAVGTGLTPPVLVLSGSIELTPMQVISISDMTVGSAMVVVELCYSGLGQWFDSEQQQIRERLSLGATPKAASTPLIRDSIHASLTPTIDSARTVGLMSLPGMMLGLIFTGIDPVKAIKYQIMVALTLFSIASLLAIVVCYLIYRKFYNSRYQLVVTPSKKP